MQLLRVMTLTPINPFTYSLFLIKRWRIKSLPSSDTSDKKIKNKINEKLLN